MRAYLMYKMRTENVSCEDIRKELNVSEKTVRNKLSGRTDFTWNEAKAIRNKFFKNEEYETLFEDVGPVEPDPEEAG